MQTKKVKYGTWSWKPAHNASVFYAEPYATCFKLASPSVLKFSAITEDYPLQMADTTCAISRSPNAWYTKHRCPNHNVVVVWHGTPAGK